jgi:tRNA A-37 threonylcarbamoyl transferase component Bud32
MAELIEAIGYVAIGRSHDVGERAKLNACRSLGAMVATLHRLGYIHGDLQPENFSFKENGKSDPCSIWGEPAIGTPSHTA